MQKYIVITTINEPTKATIKFANISDWKLPEKSRIFFDLHQKSFNNE